MHCPCSSGVWGTHFSSGWQPRANDLSRQLVLWETSNSADEVSLARQHDFMDVINAESVLYVFILDMIIFHILHSNLEDFSNGFVMEAREQTASQVC